MMVRISSLASTWSMRFSLDVQRLAAQGQDRLRLPHARLLCGAARRIPFDDEQLVQLRFFARAGGELADERQVVDAVFRARDLLCLPRRNAHFCRALRLFDDLFKDGAQFYYLRTACRAPRPSRSRRAPRASGLPSFVLVCPSNCTFFILDGEDRRQALAEVLAQKIRVLVFERAEGAH